MVEPTGWVDDPPYLRTTLATGDVIEVLLGGDEPDRLTVALDFTVIRGTGQRWAGTAATPAHLQEIMRRWQVTGEHGGGSHVVIPDLVVLDRPSLSCLHEAVVDLLAEGAIERHLVAIDDASPVTTVPDELRDDVAALEQRFATEVAWWDPSVHSVDRALEFWSAFVEGRIRLGYIEEHIHALGDRDALLDVMSAATGPLAVWLIRAVESIDEVFHRSTDLDTEDLMWGSGVDDPVRWWHRRLPRDSDLRRDIAALADEMRTVRRGPAG